MNERNRWVFREIRCPPNILLSQSDGHNCGVAVIVFTIEFMLSQRDNIYTYEEFGFIDKDEFEQQINSSCLEYISLPPRILGSAQPQSDLFSRRILP